MRIHNTTRKLKTAISSFDPVIRELSKVEDDWKLLREDSTRKSSILVVDSQLEILKIPEPSKPILDAIETLKNCEKDREPSGANLDQELKSFLQLMNDLNEKIDRVGALEYMEVLKDLKDLKNFLSVAKEANENNVQFIGGIAKKMTSDPKFRLVKRALAKCQDDLLSLTSLVSEIPATVKKIKSEWNTVDDYQKKVNGTHYTKFYDCVKQVGDQSAGVKLVFENVDKVRKIEKLDTTKSVIQAIQDSQKDLKSLKGSLEDLKKVTSLEALALKKVFPDSQDVSRRLKTAAQGFNAIGRALEARGSLNPLLNSTILGTVLNLAQSSDSVVLVEKLPELNGSLSTTFENVDEFLKVFDTERRRRDVPNFEANRKILVAASKIADVQVPDVDSLKTALEDLASKPKLPEIQDLSSALDSLKPLNLEFSKFEFANSVSSLAACDAFFIAYSKVSTTPPRPIAQPRVAQNPIPSTTPIVTTSEATEMEDPIMAHIKSYWWIYLIAVVVAAIIAAIFWFTRCCRKEKEEPGSDIEKNDGRKPGPDSKPDSKPDENKGGQGSSITTALPTAPLVKDNKNSTTKTSEVVDDPLKEKPDSNTGSQSSDSNQVGAKNPDPNMAKTSKVGKEEKRSKSKKSKKSKKTKKSKESKKSKKSKESKVSKVSRVSKASGGSKSSGASNSRIKKAKSNADVVAKRIADASRVNNAPAIWAAPSTPTTHGTPGVDPMPWLTSLTSSILNCFPKNLYPVTAFMHILEFKQKDDAAATDDVLIYTKPEDRILMRYVCHENSMVAVEGFENSYINMNMTVFDGKKWFIGQMPMDGNASETYQGAKHPKNDTRPKTLAMMMQQQVATVIQTYPFEIDDKRASARFYSDEIGEQMTFGDYSVKTVRKEENLAVGKTPADLTKFQLEIKNGKTSQSHTVDVYNHDWPLLSAPEELNDAMNLIRICEESKGNVLLMCRTGLGPSGTLLGIKCGIELCRQKPVRDLYELLQPVRDVRFRAVQTKDELFCLLAGVAKGANEKMRLPLLRNVCAIRFFYKRHMDGEYPDTKKKRSYDFYDGEIGEMDKFCDKEMGILVEPEAKKKNEENVKEEKKVEEMKPEPKAEQNGAAPAESKEPDLSDINVGF